MIDLRRGDCLKVMPTLEAGSIDLILADLPYGTTACKWDSVIPFAPLWENYKRLLKPRGAVVLTASQPFTSALVMSNPKWFRYEWVWEKNNATGHLDARRKPLRAHEDICVFGDSRPTYNPTMGEGKPFISRHRPGDTGDCYGDVRNYIWKNTGTRFPRSVLRFPNVSRTIHPTQKPVALIEYLIRTYSSEGETVLDNTMGSGTTGVACVNTGRNFIGIEMDAAYFKIAKKRIHATEPQLICA